MLWTIVLSFTLLSQHFTGLLCEPSCPYVNPSEAMRLVSNGISSIASSTHLFFLDFRSLVNEIMPKLSEEEQHQVSGTFRKYHSMLSVSQVFLTRTTMRVNRAKTQEDLVHAIDVNILKELCDSTIDLLEQFQTLSRVVDARVKDKTLIRQWRDLSLGIAITFGAILIISSGVGAAVGWPMLAQSVMSLSGAGCIVGLSSAHIAKNVLEMSAFEPIRKNLAEIKRLLAQLSQRFGKINGMAGELIMDDRSDLLRVLKEAEDEVDKGYEILGRM